MTPASYSALCRRLPSLQASLGYDGIQLYSNADIPTAQTGYSTSAEGASLCGGSPGDWRHEWLVIGHTLSSGEPIILDTSSSCLRVLTDFNGCGVWEPWQIADTAESFAEAFLLLINVGHGREHPVALSENPLPSSLRDSTLQAIANSNPNSDLQFWEGLLRA